MTRFLPAPFLWQFYFYLETDIYHVITTLLGATDLQGSAKAHLRNGIRRPRHRPVAEWVGWSRRDRRLARLYAPVLVLGYLFSFGVLLLAGAPVFLSVVEGMVRGLTGGQSLTRTLDSLLFLALTVAQVGVLIVLARRDRRAARADLEAA